MELSRVLYTLVLIAVGLERLLELGISRRHQRQLAALGATKVAEQRFRWMVLLHAGILVGAGLEVWLLRRPLLPPLALAMGLVFVLATALRWWTIRTLAEHWNVEVMNSTPLGVVVRGPYCFIRHPNYLAVILELAAIPLLYTAWIVALIGSLLNAAILKERIAVEEAVLFGSLEYHRAMAHKLRFIPRHIR